MTEPVLIGTYGWDVDQWVGSFYPEELPDDWRLAYYSSLLPAVLVPAETSRRMNPELAQQWCADTDEKFQFIVELSWLDCNALSASKTLSPYLQAFTDLGPRLAGYYLVLSEPEAPLNALLQLHANLSAPLCVVLPDGVADFWHETLVSHGIGCVWQPDKQPLPLAGGGLMLTLTQEETPKGQRHLLEALDRWLVADAQAALIVTGSRQAPELAKQAKLLAEIMAV
jgi:hypothetical protein